MILKILFLCLCLLVTPSLGWVFNRHRQPTLSPSKSPFEPVRINLEKKVRSFEEQDKLISFIQAEAAKIKSPSFLQTAIKTFKLDGSKDTAKVPLENSMNTQYSGKIAVGDDDDYFDVIFDTGSTAFFVNSKLCKQKACRAHTMYDPHDSDTLIATEPLLGVQVVYGSGTLDGVLVKEDVYVGDIKAEQMDILLINKQLDVLDQASFDGIMGLSLPERGIGGLELVSIFDVVKDQLPAPYFSFHLGRNDEDDSYLMLGGYDEDEMDSDITWHRVIDSSYWMLELKNVYVGDKSIEFCKEYRCGAIIDTGTSILTAPEIAMYEMQELLGTDILCDDLDSLPNIGFEIDDQRYELTPDEYILTLTSRNKLEFYEHSSNAIKCSGSFTPMNLQAPNGAVVFILGDTFLTKYYSVFHRGERFNEIGLALQKR